MSGLTSQSAPILVALPLHPLCETDISGKALAWFS